MSRTTADQSRIHVDEVQLMAATEPDRQRGLAGYLRFRVNGGLLIDGVTLRRTQDGRWVLSYPERRDRHGRSHPILRPASDAVRATIASQVLESLGLQAEGNG